VPLDLVYNMADGLGIEPDAILVRNHGRRTGHLIPNDAGKILRGDIVVYR
jgi:hypothetical protein